MSKKLQKTYQSKGKMIHATKNSSLFVSKSRNNGIYKQQEIIHQNDKRRKKAKIVCAKKEKKFQEILKNWEKENYINHKGSTEAKYDYLIKRHIIPELGDLPISAITTNKLNSFAEKKLSHGRLDNSGGLSPAYVRSMMLIISAALQYANKEGLYQLSKTNVFKPQADKKNLKILSLQEQKILENFLLNDMTETKLGILLSLNCGLRIGEICALKWDDIDLENSVIHVRSTVARIKNNEANGTVLIIDRPKTNAALRDIPIHSQLLITIAKMSATRKSLFVVSNSSDFVSPRTYEYRYHRLLQQCGIKPYNYHALRHTFATKCIFAGVDVKTLSEILGHSNTAITLNTYVHPSIEMKLKQIEKITDSNCWI